MRRIVLDMQNMLFSDAVAKALREFDSDFDVFQSEGPTNIPDICSYISANVLIMEVTPCSPRTLEERMQICNGLKQTNPFCKTVLIVDEITDGKLADRVRLVKKDGLIDSFVYSSVSAAYLSAVVDTL